MTKEELEKEAEEWRNSLNYEIDNDTFNNIVIPCIEFGYNKAKEEMQKQDYSLFDFVMQYENGKYKCKYKSGKVFESVDGEIWKENYNSKKSE